jgi:hypothetical protein
MKTIFCACAVAAAIVGASARARAQDISADQSVSWGFAAGADEVTGAFRTGHAFQPGVAGLAIGALVQLPLAAPRLALRADVMYHQLGLGDCRPTQLCGSQKLSTQLVSGSVSLVARLNDVRSRVSPYVLAGAAVYGTSYADDNITAMHPGHIGFAGGIGIESRTKKSTFFAELRYMAIPPGGVVPLTLGMRF